MIIKYSHLAAKQSEEFFQKEWEESYDSAVQEIIKEFSQRKALEAKRPDGSILWILSMSTKQPNTIQLTFSIPWETLRGILLRLLTKKGCWS